MNDIEKKEFENRALSILSQVERKSVGVVAIKFSWNESEHSVCHFQTSNGWDFKVFNDAGEWDYFDEIISPEGITVTFDEIAGNWPKDKPAMPKLFGYESYADCWINAKVKK